MTNILGRLVVCLLFSLAVPPDALAEAPRLPNYRIVSFGMSEEVLLSRMPNAAPMNLGGETSLKMYDLPTFHPIIPGFGAARTSSVGFSKKTSIDSRWRLFSISGEYSQVVANKAIAKELVDSKLRDMESTYGGKPTIDSKTHCFVWKLPAYSVRFTPLYLPPPLNQLVLQIQIFIPTN